MKCRYCNRELDRPCMNTRDMDPDDGFNADPVCHQALSDLGGGERGFVKPDAEPVSIKGGESNGR